MSEIPARIWVNELGCYFTEPNGLTEFVRADIAERMAEALEFYANPLRYQGPNQNPITDDKFARPDAVYIHDVTKDGGAIARSVISAWKDGR
jgi:hypothetical protein